MKEQQHHHSEAGGGAALIWGATAVAALLIVGVCVFIAVSRNQDHALSPVPEEMVQTSSPVVSAPKSEPPQEEEPLAVPVPDDGLPRLLLNHLAGTLKVRVPFTEIREKMPLKHSCFQDNISPEIRWSKAPPETRSYVVFMERRDPGVDPDRAFVNWIVYNVPQRAAGLPAGLPKKAALSQDVSQAVNDADTVGYVGPCEARGTYGYALRVFALDRTLPVEPGIGKYDLIRAMNGHIIDAAEQSFIHYKRM